MQKGPSKIIWAGIPGSLCNLNCSYCYTGQDKGEKEKCLYSVEHMLKCFEPKRFDGPVFFGGASSGETLLWDEIINFTKGMLSFGHFVSYTTNMTITPVIEKFCSFPAGMRSRLELDASLHYLELKRKKMLEIYFENLRMLKSAGISIALFLCIPDIYIPYLREIRELCKKEIGLLPIAGMLRKYKKNSAKITIKCSSDIDKLVRKTCDVRQWELQKRIYGQKRTEFCHAGEYSINLDLGTGNYTKCWGSNGIEHFEKKLCAASNKILKTIPLISSTMRRIYREPSQIKHNIFIDPDKPIEFNPVGKCPFYDCVCASYLCWGLIPELDVGTHSKTFFTRGFVSKEIWDFFDSKIGQQK